MTVVESCPAAAMLEHYAQLLTIIGDHFGVDAESYVHKDFTIQDIHVEAASLRSETRVLQAVLDAISGTLDPHTQIADHPNVKFAQMQRLKLLALSYAEPEP